MVSRFGGLRLMDSPPAGGADIVHYGDGGAKGNEWVTHWTVEPHGPYGMCYPLARKGKPETYDPAAKELPYELDVYAT